jgi:glycosidase
VATTSSGHQDRAKDGATIRGGGHCPSFLAFGKGPREGFGHPRGKFARPRWGARKERALSQRGWTFRVPQKGPRRHGTFDDVVRRLPSIRDMGFDVVYFPPIHPIGKTNRKGRNNALKAGPDDPGSPYAIGSDEGGHDAIHPALGTLEGFLGLIR